MKNVEVITKKYLSLLLNVDNELLYKKGVYFVSSDNRVSSIRGYSKLFDLYAYVANELIIVSYGKKFKDSINKLKEIIHKEMDSKEFSKKIKEVYNLDASTYMKFIYEKHIKCKKNAVRLQKSHFNYFYDFFVLNNPDYNNISWLEDYFELICSKNYCFGIFEDNKLVSVTDAPTMPFMEELIQEIGITTSPDYRCKGFAKIVCSSFIDALLKNNVCPYWSCEQSNYPSEMLAYSLGFKKLADIVIS